MSAAERVEQAAKTVRARWERQVSTDPQTEAAQALEDTGQLLDPEAAAELVAFRALELGAVDGRVSAACGDPAHPTWLRKPGDLRGCPWCRVAELEAGIAWRDAERGRWSGVHYLIEKAIDKGWSTLDTLDVEAELGPEVAAPVQPVAEPSRLCPPADQPGPHQVGCPLAEVPRLPERPVDELTATFAPVAALREALSREEPHDSPLHQEHRLPHDMPGPEERLLSGDELGRAVRGHLFGGGS